MSAPALALALAQAPRTIGFADKVDFLSVPAHYPTHPARVEVRETHMSVVFLTDTEVYKLKKPVRYPFLDFSTLAAREADCRAEVALNSRLAPGVYRGVVALTRSDDGPLSLDGAGTVIDWLVRMRRLPADRMLDRMIATGRLQLNDVSALGERLADFYAHQPRVELTGDAFVATLAREHRQNMELLTQPRFALDRDELRRIGVAVDAFFTDEHEVLRARVTQGRVVDGHGDLRPEHVCLDRLPVIIDCLEFNRSLRLVDWADEIAFLGLECALLGAAWVGPAVQASIEAHLDDPVPPRLTNFYTALRACLRARLAVAHLLEPAPRDGARWLPRARTYLRAAAASCIAWGAGRAD